jgi:signal peptidase I
MALYAYPREFRARFGREMEQVFRARLQQAPNVLRFLLATAQDLAVTATEERLISMTMSRLFRGLAYATAAAVLILGAGVTMVQAYVIPTSSMEPSLRIGDHFLVNKLARDPQRGDLIAFRYPADPSQGFIKRVIGVPGDRIRLDNKQVVRNGQRLVESYVQHTTDYIDQYRDNFPKAPNVHIEPRAQEMLAKNATNGEVTVPEGAFFVLGDNRDVSLDSRFIGFVPQANIIGRPWMVYWSFDAEASKTRWERTLRRVR